MTRKQRSVSKRLDSIESNFAKITRMVLEHRAMLDEIVDDDHDLMRGAGERLTKMLSSETCEKAKGSVN